MRKATTALSMLAALMLGAAAMGCEKEPVSRAVTDNAAIVDEVLFTKDGCTVHRFRDDDFHYYVVCDRGRSAAVEQTRTERRTCGKTCSVLVTVADVAPVVYRDTQLTNAGASR